MKTKFKEIQEGNVFHYEGSTYCKVTDDDRIADCFMIGGFIENNRKDEVKDDTIIEDTGLEFNEFLRSK